MKVGIWGTGNIAHTHAEALKGVGAEIVAVVDINEEIAEKFAKKWNISRYGIDKNLLISDDIDVVHVCTPPNLHYEMVDFLLENNKNVLCEKPLCFENKQAEKLVKKAKDKKLMCAINFNVRFHLACQKAKEVVKDLGDIKLIHGSYLQEFNAFPAPLDWRYNEVLAGKMRAVTEIGSHFMDIAQYISGKKVVAVSALFGNFNPTRYLENNMMYTDSDNGKRKEINIISEDAACINVKYEDGAIGTVLLSEISQGRINRINLEITGEKGNLWWNSEDNNILNTAKKGCGVNSEIFAFGNGFADTFKTLVKEYYEDLNTGVYKEDTVYPTFVDGENIVKICNALLESSLNDAKWIEIK